MTWTEFEDALHGRLVALSGLAGDRVCFTALPGPAPSAAPYIRIEFISVATAGTIDSVSATPHPTAGAEATQTTAQRIRVSVRAQVFGAGALALAAVVLAALQSPANVAACDAAGISITDASLQRLPVFFETAIQDRAALTLTVWAWLTASTTSTVIETVYGEGTYSPGPVIIPTGPITLGD